ncbi:MAG: cytochrome c [Pseudomonadota bacterium]
MKRHIQIGVAVLFAAVVVQANAAGPGHRVSAVPPEDQLAPFTNPIPTITKAQRLASPVGEQVYQKWCARCHEPGTGAHPGTQMLSLSRGEEVSVIKANDSLDQDYIIDVVRNGLGMMPAFRHTEISNTELTALADLLGMKIEE